MCKFFIYRRYGSGIIKSRFGEKRYEISNSDSGNGRYHTRHFTYNHKRDISKVLFPRGSGFLFSKNYDTVSLDASLSAVWLYEHRGYKTVGHGIYKLQNDVKLVYEIMEKKLLCGNI